ncbi:unnamed protein product [Amoebophrya sp. A120]|nr:unnamed protein product [Amoebophrya sp. A120]|eukprot:GSA120T00011781001.1
MATSDTTQPMLHARYVLGGSGSDLFSEPRVCTEIMQMIHRSRRETAQKQMHPDEATSASAAGTSTGSSSSSSRPVRIVYFGTAAYDAPASFKRQTDEFVKAGASVSEIRCTTGGKASIRWITPATETSEERVVDAGKRHENGSISVNEGNLAEIAQFVSEEADAVLISGGNTLYAVDRLRGLGIDQWIRRAAARGAVMCGGSAGAVLWFETGHSDSADPDSFYSKFMELERMKREVLEKTGEVCDESTVRQRYNALMEAQQLAPLTLQEKSGEAKESKPSLSQVFEDQDNSAANNAGVETPAEPPAVAKPWEYIRIPGIGMLPGLCVPHQDKVQSNGSLRADHVNEMLTRLAFYGGRERAICIDHWAVLVLENGQYQVLSFPDKVGSGLSCKEREWKPLQEEIIVHNSRTNLPVRTVVRLVDGLYADAKLDGATPEGAALLADGNNAPVDRVSLDLENLRLSQEDGPDRVTVSEKVSYVKDRTGKPCVWIKETKIGQDAEELTDMILHMQAAPWAGSVDDLFALNRSQGDCPITAQKLRQVRELNPAF